jgi:hypothetical protein
VTKGPLTTTWLSFTVSLLVLVLLTKSAVCATRCIGFVYHGGGNVQEAKVPPCHEKKSSTAPAEPCEQESVVATVDSPAIGKSGLLQCHSLQSESGAMHHSPYVIIGPVGENTSPPGLVIPQSSVVLRI